jgi:cellulose synthase/poly-beta-1,6-N-acetylglucosamine synthase-like glycosyltransferase
VSGPPAGTLHGKANALQHGIAASGGEILMFTDADCRVPRTWVKETVSRFDPGTAVVGGFTLLDARTPFEGMQQLDWIMLFGVAASAAGWGSPLTAIGNNLSVRRSAYDACGGFAGIPFSVTEDYALVQAILRTTRMNVRFPLSPGALVASKPCGSFWQLYRQKQRWVVGGLDMVFRGLLIMAFGWIYRALLVIGWAFVPLPWYLGAVAVIIALEAMFLARPLRAFGAIASLRHLAAFQLYYLPYVLLTPLVAMLSKDVVWKERTLTKEGN